MKIFLRWELDLYTNVQKQSIFNIPANTIVIVQTAYLLKMDFTVDEIRNMMGFPPHPDKVRGSKFIWEEDESKPEDLVIPTEILEIFVPKIDPKIDPEIDPVTVEDKV